MDTQTGEIRELVPEQKTMPTEVLLSMIEADYLQAKATKDRPEIYSELHSHNNSKKRRALRRMQNESRRRNRK